MNANFAYGDYHLVLDYIRHKGESDRTREEMKKIYKYSYASVESYIKKLD